MLFNSIEFFFFLPALFILYWIIPSKKYNLQNIVLLFASYFFYGWWDWRFLILISASALVGFVFALAIEKTQKKSLALSLLVICISINLLFLGFFKYYNFFATSLNDVFSFWGLKADFITIELILPLGISFYTFHNISYIVDVYRKHIPATKDIVVYLSFMSFFPQLIAGPIQRAKDLIPQFTKERIFNVEIATSGMQQILWGLFKKVVIADVCAIHCNEIFNDYEHYSSIGLIVGAVYFSFQIYGDFSGYTDIACGVAKLFGFSFFNNFNYPYFAESISSFWRKWHISLTTWFKDYIYIPLGGNKKGRFLTLFNSSVIFLISGFWHGANWTYVLWGMLNLVYFIPSILFPEAKNNKQDTRWYIRLFNIVSTFSLITFAWIFFRADSIGDAFNYIKGILSLNFHHIEYNKFEYIPLIVLLVIWEWFHKETDNPLALQNTKQWIRWLIYFIVCWLILFFWGEEVEFIYFQF